MEAALGGTGVFYQAMPAIGADGKRIMKLIPVQMVNGQYVQTQTSKPKAARPSQPAALEPHRLAPKPPAGPAAAQPCGRTVSSGKVPSTPVDPGLSRLLIQQQPQAVSVSSKVPLKTAFGTTGGESVPGAGPVTANSPAVPKGQYLQILPPNAQVWTVPASQLPQGIKTQIVTSQGTSSPTPGALNVVFVSPVTTVGPGVSPPGEPSAGSLRQLPATCRQTSAAKPQLKLIPKVSHRPNSPTRWVVEEVGDTAVANGKPSHSSNFFQTDHQGGAVYKEACLQSSKDHGAEAPALPRRWVIEEEHVAAGASPSAASEILRVLSGTERVDESPPSQGRKDTLLMCNGKVFYVAKKNDPSFQATSPTNGSEFQQTVASCSAPARVDGTAAKSRAERRTLGEVDEVIDLCDEEEPPQGPVAPPDEDNVIFVSYSPPKSQSGSTSHNVPLVVPGTVRERADWRRSGEPEPTWPAGLHVATSNLPDVLEVDAETESPGDQSRTETKSPGDQSRKEAESRTETKSPGDQRRTETESSGDQSRTETKSPGDQRRMETESSGDQSRTETKSPGDQSRMETDSPGDQSRTETKSSGDQSRTETESPGDQSRMETKSPGDQSRTETKSPGDQSRTETESSGDQSRTETKSPGDQSRTETESPGDQSRTETKSPGDQSRTETESPGDQSRTETKDSVNVSTRCPHMSTAEWSRTTDAQLRQIHGVTAEVQVVLQRVDEAAPHPEDKDRGPGSAPEDGDVWPNARRLGRTRKRTICKCCGPEATSSTRVAGDGPTEPPGKKGSGAKAPAGEDLPCRRHGGQDIRARQDWGNSKDLKQRVRIRTVQSLLHETLRT